jgi:hypothetical protein
MSIRPISVAFTEVSSVRRQRRFAAIVKNRQPLLSATVGNAFSGQRRGYSLNPVRIQIFTETGASGFAFDSRQGR